MGTSYFPLCTPFSLAESLIRFFYSWYSPLCIIGRRQDYGCNASFKLVQVKDSLHDELTLIAMRQVDHLDALMASFAYNWPIDIRHYALPRWALHALLRKEYLATDA